MKSAQVPHRHNKWPDSALRGGNISVIEQVKFRQDYPKIIRDPLSLQRGKEILS